MEWIDKHIVVQPHKRPKKITANRFATILGLNHWSTEFEANVLPVCGARPNASASRRSSKFNIPSRSPFSEIGSLCSY